MIERSAWVPVWQAKGEGVSVPADPDCGTVADLFVEERGGEGVGQSLLDDPLQGAGAVGGVEPFVGKLPFGLVADGDGQASLRELAFQALELDVHDPGQLGHPERVEDDRIVDPVEELGEELGLEHLQHSATDLGLIAGRGLARDLLAAEV